MNQLSHNRRLVLVANTGWYLWNFRKGLAESAQQAGYDVVLVSPRDSYVDKITDHGFTWREWTISRSGMNPLNEWRAIQALTVLYRELQPSIVHHFTLKPILYGTCAAIRAGIPFKVNTVTGLGHMFTTRSLPKTALRQVLRPWLQACLHGQNVRAFFQSRQDFETLCEHSPAIARQCLTTIGSGFDSNRFQFIEFDFGEINHPKIIFVGRLLEEKGVREFVEAARLCREKNSRLEFIACGTADPGNPSSIDDQTLDAWKQEQVVDFRGHVENVEEILQDAYAVVLPSYREGTPRVLLEASALGKPLIATDVPGCRDLVDQNLNGLLVPPRDPRQLADAVLAVAEDPEAAKRMGEAGRYKAERKYDQRFVNQLILNTYGDSQRDAIDTSSSVGTFTMSLDFELAWGTRGRPTAKLVEDALKGTRPAISELLRIFDRWEFSATWAVVGALFVNLLQRKHPLLSNSAFDDVPIGNCATQPNWYAEDVLGDLLSCATPQEIGCHTFSHLFVDPSPQGRLPFEREIEVSLELFEELSLPRPKSFIYPKAKMGHFGVLAEYGFQAVRGPESKWFESLPGTYLSAATRLIDARLAIPPVVSNPKHVVSGLWEIPSSQFYSPFMGVGKHVSIQSRVEKAIKGLHAAAQHKKVFHLWTHPFNLGEQTEELTEGLDQIFREASKLRAEGKIRFGTMWEIAHEAEMKVQTEPFAVERPFIGRDRLSHV